MAVRCIVSSHKDALVRDLNPSLHCVLRLAPLKVKDIVCKVAPFTTQVHGEIELFKHFAVLIVDVLAHGPAGGERPVLLRWVESELIDFLARVEGTNLSAAVGGDVVDACRPYQKLTKEIRSYLGERRYSRLWETE